MKRHLRLLEANKKWVSEHDPDYFHNLSLDQSPEYLWIGCSDSRVPAEQVTGAKPGEIFVHRNIANLVHHNDLNVMSVLQYAVEVLKVKHVIVCGHYGCGGVRAALGATHLGLLNKWIRSIKDTYQANFKNFVEITDPNKRLDELVELNVVDQVYNIAKTSVVQKVWAQGEFLLIHGWIFDLKTGALKEIKVLDSVSDLDEIFRYKFNS